jgi:hypothetical protein
LQIRKHHKIDVWVKLNNAVKEGNCIQRQNRLNDAQPHAPLPLKRWLAITAQHEKHRGWSNLLPRAHSVIAKLP